MMALLSIFLALLFLYSLVPARMERTILTAPMLFTAAGILSALLLPGVREQKTSAGTLVGLMLLLFIDASRTSLQLLNSLRNLPMRLAAPAIQAGWQT